MIVSKPLVIAYSIHWWLQLKLFFPTGDEQKNGFFLFSLILLEKYKTIVSHAFSLKNNTMYKTKK